MKLREFLEMANRDVDLVLLSEDNDYIELKKDKYDWEVTGINGVIEQVNDPPIGSHVESRYNFKFEVTITLSKDMEKSVKPAPDEKEFATPANQTPRPYTIKSVIVEDGYTTCRIADNANGGQESDIVFRKGDIYFNNETRHLMRLENVWVTEFGITMLLRDNEVTNSIQEIFWGYDVGKDKKIYRLAESTNMEPQAGDDK